MMLYRIMMFKYISDEEICIIKYTYWNELKPTFEIIETIKVDYTKNKETIDRIKKYF